MKLREIWDEIVFVPRLHFFVRRDGERVTNVYRVSLNSPRSRHQKGAFWRDGRWYEDIDVLGQYLFWGFDAYTHEVGEWEVERWMNEHTRQRESGEVLMNEEMLEAKARAFAEAAHADQKYGDAPYVKHLSAVRSVLVESGYHPPFTVAAWLHDVVEDTPVTREEVEANFGSEVAELVWAVTGVGATREERVHAAYEKIKKHPPAAVLKLADRIANVEASRDYPKKLALYRGEHASFRKNLGKLGSPNLWARLELALGIDEAEESD